MKTLGLLIGVLACGCNRGTTSDTQPPVTNTPVAVTHGTPAAEAGPCVQPWMEAWAAEQGLAPGACGRLRLDDDDALEPVLQVCSGDGHRAVYLVDDGPAGHWVIEHEGWGHTPVCEATAVLESTDAIALLDNGPGDFEDRRVALRQGRPVIITHASSSAREPPARWEEQLHFDRERLVRTAASDTPCEPGPAEVEAEASIIVVGGGPTVANFVTEGETRHEGSADAELRVWAQPVDDTHLELRIQTRDDQLLPRGSAAVRASTDAVVLHWATRDASRFDPLGCDIPPVELRIEPIADGPLGVSGSGAAAAIRVEGRLADLRILLDLNAMESTGDHWMLPFTVAMIDADTDGVSVLATSQVVAAHPGSYGVLLRNPENARFPPIGRKID